MELKRRQFMKLLAAATAATAVGIGHWIKAAPRRVIRALRPRGYPGRVRELDPEEISRTSRWEG